MRLLIRSLRIKEKDFRVPKNSNLFIGGITGRTGTTWLMQVLRTILGDKYVLISEHGSFTLSQFRNAGYEYYQGMHRGVKNRESYLRFFYKFVMTEAYDRRKIYRMGSSVRGFRNVLPRRAVKLAFKALKTDLENARSLQQCNICFGNFYSHLLNLYALLKNDTLNWISKEPSYGRHIRDLYELLPDCRVVVMVRDGRDTALSMANRGWHNGDIIRCIDRWKAFTQMTFDSLERVPRDNYLLVKYEQMILDFRETLRDILEFYFMDSPNDFVENSNVENFKYSPFKDNFDKWKQELNEKELNYFEQTCGELSKKVGYEI